jgi:hypothetical protein
MANKEKSNTEKMRQKFADKALDTEQLENVAGGTKQQNQQDLDFLRKLLKEPLYVPNDNYAPLNTLYRAQDGWKKVGVRSVASLKDDQPNCYYIGDLQVSQQEAMDYAKRVVAQRNKK